MSHDRLGPTTEYRQEFVDQPPLCLFARDGGFKDVRVADPFNAAKSLFSLQPIYDGLHGRIGRPGCFRKSLLNLTDGARAFLPQRFEHLQFQFREPWSGHNRLRTHSSYYDDSLIASSFRARPA